MWIILALAIFLLLCTDAFCRQVIWQVIAPISDIVVCVVFIILLAVLLVCEIAMMVIAPVALILGYDSSKWHIELARKIMLTKVFGSDESGS